MARLRVVERLAGRRLACQRRETPIPTQPKHPAKSGAVQLQSRLGISRSGTREARHRMHQCTVRVSGRGPQGSANPVQLSKSLVDRGSDLTLPGIWETAKPRNPNLEGALSGSTRMQCKRIAICVNNLLAARSE